RWSVFVMACPTKIVIGDTAFAPLKVRMTLPAWRKWYGGDIRASCSELPSLERGMPKRNRWPNSRRKTQPRSQGEFLPQARSSIQMRTRQRTLPRFLGRLGKLARDLLPFGFPI